MGRVDKGRERLREFTYGDADGGGVEVCACLARGLFRVSCSGVIATNSMENVPYWPYGQGVYPHEEVFRCRMIARLRLNTTLEWSGQAAPGHNQE